MEPEKLPPPDRAPSLVEQVGKAARQAPADPRGAVRLGLALAVLLPLGPVLTTLGAERMGAAAARPAVETDEATASRRERSLLARLGPASLAATIDRLARLLPPEARIVAVEVDHEGETPALTAEIATADPDQLRAALSRGGGTGWRAVSERRGDGVLIVSVEGRP